MAKLIHIRDVKPMEVFIGRRTRGPIKMRMEDEVVRRLLIQHDGPKHIFAVGPDDKEVRLTTENYKLSIEELFTPFAEKEAEMKAKEEAAKLEEQQNLLIKQSLEALSKKEEAKKEVVEIKEETTETDIEDELDDIEDNKVVQVEVPEEIKVDEEVKEEKLTEEEVKAEIAPPKPRPSNKSKKTTNKGTKK